MQQKLIVGLGNPGHQYSTTRHNAGFLLIDRLIERFAALPQSGTGRYLLWQFEADGTPVHLMKPMTYMNLSGDALADYAGRHPLTSERMLVAYDDVALALGMIRMRAAGSSGGQKGIRHIIESMGSEVIPRLRIGIRAANVLDRSLADFVLADFDQEEIPLFREALARAADACALWLAQGMTAAMAAFNVRASSANQKPDPDANSEGNREGTHLLGGES